MERPGRCIKEFDPRAIYRTILVPVDFSLESRQAFLAACDLRERYGSEVHVFVMRGGGENDGFLGSLGNPTSRDEVLRHAREQVHYFAERLCDGAPCEIDDVSFGDDVVGGIAEAVKQSHATLVLLAVHDKQSLWRSRAEKIVRALEVPVLLLKHAAELPGAVPEGAVMGRAADPVPKVMQEG